MAADDKERARQLRAEARRRRRDEALRRYRERTASGEPSPEASGKRRRAAVEADEGPAYEIGSFEADDSAPTGLRRRESEESTPDESERAAEHEAVEREAREAEVREVAEREAREVEAREAAEREAREAEVREVAEREAREAAEHEERERRKPLTAAEIAGAASAADPEEPSGELPGPGSGSEHPLEASPEEVGEDQTVSMTEGLPAAPRDIAPRDLSVVASAGTASDVPAPTSPRRSVGVRGLRALGTVAVALGSIASLLLALGALTLALGERPAGLFDLLEPVCRTLAFGTGDDTAAVDLLVTWIIAGLAYLVIGFAVQSFTRRVTRRRSRG
ncbi:hypothetical protein JL108_05545 [Aeromicrobium sp. YIM 150415]|uniref:hypothetical protein n=1 Tax=Aeromicrobium sp. YIM 150415 TaxID=2803912 RepID=UPI001965D986|nr:hypothetical protein [Aeromicrobium sp. YIM 150415]MBM9462906.1 hypothetical protein [Aeromicrobium sp. YIM 150415]